MSEQTPFAFGKLIPGFDFLQQLAAGGTSRGSVGLGHWVAPTVSVEELEQRITELKAVQFWLEQNLLALKATVQALEVQKMTLATLRGMNLSVAEVAKAFAMPAAAAAPEPPSSEGVASWPFQSEARAPAPAAEAPHAAPEPAPEAAPEEAAAPQAPVKRKPVRRRAAAAAPSASESATAGLADPMQWWGALTQQFQQIAAQTLREAARAAPTAAAEPTVAGQGTDATARKPAAGKKKAARSAAARKKPSPRTRKATPTRAAAAGWPLPTPPQRKRP